MDKPIRGWDNLQCHTPYEDNCLSLLPREKRDVRLEYDGALLRGDEAKILVDGWNVQALVPARRHMRWNGVEPCQGIVCKRRKQTMRVGSMGGWMKAVFK